MSMRHECQEPDKLSKYGWRMHDGYGYGWQELADSPMGLNITTEFVNIAAGTPNATRERWGARISIAPTSNMPRLPPRNVSLAFYMAVQNVEHTVALREAPGKKGLKGPVHIGGTAGKDINKYRLRIQTESSAGHVQADKVRDRLVSFSRTKRC